MQAVGIKTALACILFGISSLGPGGHFKSELGVSLRPEQGGHFATEFPVIESGEMLVAKRFKRQDSLRSESCLYSYYLHLLCVLGQVVGEARCHAVRGIA